jgi:hypothetical protein
MKILGVLLFSLFLVNSAFAKGRVPCSGYIGGIKHCTADHKFMCRDGSVSASMKKCLR